MKHISSLVLLSFVFCLSLSVMAKETQNVILEQCDELTFDKNANASRSYQVLRGNVRFRHGDALMWCDSAYFYDGENSFDAFGHIRVNQEQSSMLADSLFYDGNTTLMRVRGNVVLNSKEISLYTNFLDYNREKKFGYYYGGGKVVETQNTLTSRRGYYYPDTECYLFLDSVVLIHPDYEIRSDSLRYFSTLGTAYLYGPSHIYGKDYTVFTTNGWTDTKNNKGKLYDYSIVTMNDGKRLTADSIYYDSNLGYVNAFIGVDIKDSLQNVIIRGDYAEYNRNYPRNALVTKNPYILEFSDKDTLYLSSDTLFYCQVDSIQDEVRAYRNVKFFRVDMQGKCDSMVFYVQDSLGKMFYDPILWSEDNQMTGDRIDIYTKEKRPDKIHITKNAMMSSFENINMYNQLAGKEAFAYIEKNRLRRIDMKGNAESIYYTKDEDGAYIGVNKAKGEEMTIFTDNNKLEKIVMTPESEGVMYPPNKFPEDERYLRNFSWEQDLRPKRKEDVIGR